MSKQAQPSTTAMHREAFRPTRGKIMGGIQKTFSAIRRYKRWILWTTLLSLACGFIYIAMTDPLYRATSQLFINKQAQSQIQSSGKNSNFSLLENEIKTINSDNILSKVLQEENNLAPLQAVRERDPLDLFIDSIKHFLTLETTPLADTDHMEIPEFRTSLHVTQLPNSYVLDISVYNKNPQRAARLVNLVIKTYLEERAEPIGPYASKNSKMNLGPRAEALRNTMKVAEAKVDAYRTASGLVGATPNLISDDQLSDLKSRVEATKAKAHTLRARYEFLYDHSVLDGLTENSQEAVSSQVVSNLRFQLADIKHRETEALTQLGPRHPNLNILRNERDGINRLLTEELNRLVRAAKHDLDVAEANEKFAQRQFEDLGQQSLENHEMLVKLRQLEQEAASSRSVLEGFITTATQQEEPEKTTNDKTRVISEATTPLTAVFPQKKPVITASLFAGLALGTILAWFRALYNTVPRTAGALSFSQGTGTGKTIKGHQAEEDWRRVVRDTIEREDPPAPLKEDKTKINSELEFQPRQHKDTPRKTTHEAQVKTEAKVITKPDLFETSPATLANALGTLLPQSGGKVAAAMADAEPVTLSIAPPAFAPCYPKHLVTLVEGGEEVIGRGGQLMGDDGSMVVSPIIPDSERNTPSPAQPGTLKDTGSPTNFPKHRPGRGTDLLKKLRR